ncbi:hypothetical protein CBR_g30367 [Chara braunii]|uniref:Uncharacterized protein n=1 Tax=Chara braunii TaxID=69332 RepID=A0A388JXH0_CHABU|nr:hypothetical protein CBR_g30367 [Chara braunii]|eukprot:GBG62413.1 hypothetical protein CBR_g30367 [Chara braunii]
MVEDPPEEIVDADVIPADVGEEEWENMDQVNRCKDGRNWITSVSADDCVTDDVSPWQDAVWMHRETMEHEQVDRGRGKVVAEDYFQTVRTLRSRVGGHVDVEGLLAREDAQEEDIEHDHEDILASTSHPQATEIGSSGAATSHRLVRPESSHHAGPVTVDSTGLEAYASATTGSPACTDNVRKTNGSSKTVVDNVAVHEAEQRLQDSVGDQAPQHHIASFVQSLLIMRGQSLSIPQVWRHMLLPRQVLLLAPTMCARLTGLQRLSWTMLKCTRVSGVKQTVVQTVDEVVQDLTGQRVEQRVDHSADRRLDERAHPSDREGSRPMVVQTVEQRVGVGLAVTVEQRAEQRVHPCAALGVNPRVEQRVEVRVNVVVEHHMDQGRLGIVRMRVGERIDESVIGAEGDVMVEERIEDRDREPPQESSAQDIALTGASFYGISPLPPRAAQSSQRESQKTSSHVVDDDPDGDDQGNTSDEMSDSDYADETCQRGQAEGGDDDSSDGTAEVAD